MGIWKFTQIDYSRLALQPRFSVQTETWNQNLDHRYQRSAKDIKLLNPQISLLLKFDDLSQGNLFTTQ